MSASYPNSVKTFASRSNGQTIDAGHVNDLQDEVAAVEAGLLGGTAGFNSSRITAVQLVVSGASTLATLNVTGGSTFTTMNVTGGSTLTQIFLPLAGRIGCKVTQSANVACGAGATVGISFDGELFDTGNQHSTAANSSRILLNQVGLWYVGAFLTWSASTSGSFRDARIMLNDVTVQGIDRRPFINGADNLPVTISALVQATSTTDYITILAVNDAGSTQSLSAAGGIQAWAALVGA